MSKNAYHKKANKKNFLTQIKLDYPPKGNAKNTMIETGKDILIGVIGGGLLSAVVGKPSLLIGIVTTGLGHYSANRMLQTLGFGMMATSQFQKPSTSSGTNGLEGTEGVKERVLAFRDSLTERLYLDKVIKKKQNAMSGFGELQYFSYPSEVGELSALDEIEQQISDSAFQFQGTHQSEDYSVTGTYTTPDYDMSGVLIDEPMY